MLALFETACVPPDRWALGMEWEKEIVDSNGRRITFEEPGGIQDALRAMAARTGWSTHHEGEYIVGLDGDGSHVTLEPGAQVEVATPPRRTLAELEEDLRSHLRALQGAFAGLDAHILSTAFTPIQAVSDIPFVPKGRYAVMRSYLAQTGELAHAMMKGTTSAQYALDFSSEADCGAKLEVALGVSALVTALTANSPLAAGRPSGDLSHRARAWLQTDPARTRIPGDVVGAFSFEKYLDWALSVPMMFVHVGGAWVDAGARTFAQWSLRGIDGHFPSMRDFDLHLTSLFPDVRLKGFLEIRGADNGPMESILGLGALWKGLLYDDAALGEGRDLCRALRARCPEPALLDTAIGAGLAGTAGGRSLASWTTDLIAIAARGLAGQGVSVEVSRLDPLLERAESGRSPAADVLEAWAEASTSAEFLGRVSYPPSA